MGTKGWVYILSTQSLKLNDVYKIGMTTKLPKIRAAELSSATGVLEPFLVFHALEVPDCRSAEQEMKRRLHPHRITSAREFYRLPDLQIAIDTLSEIANEINAGSPTSTERSSDVEFDVEIGAARKENRSRRKRAGSEAKTLENHLRVCHTEALRELFATFRKRLLELGPDIQETCCSYGVSYKARQNFVEVEFKTTSIYAWLRKGVKYDDPEKLLTERYYPSRPSFDRIFVLTSKDQLDYLVSLIRQSWEGVR